MSHGKITIIIILKAYCHSDKLFFSAPLQIATLISVIYQRFFDEQPEFHGFRKCQRCSQCRVSPDAAIPQTDEKRVRGGNCCSAAASQRLLLLLPPHLILICCRNSSSSPVLPPWPIVASSLVLVISRAFSTFGPAFESYLGGKAKTLWKGRSNSGLSSFSYCAKPRQERQKSIPKITRI